MPKRSKKRFKRRSTKTSRKMRSLSRRSRPSVPRWNLSPLSFRRAGYIKYPSHIVGPGLLIEMYSPRDDKLVYLFGEYHQEYKNYPTDTPTITDLFRLILSKHPRMLIDIFLETNYYTHLEHE